MNARKQILYFPKRIEAYDPSSVQVHVQPTAEMQVWARRLRSLIRGRSTLAVALVTPLAHVANQSFEFQAYLYGVFHRSSVARIVHLALMPLIVTATLGAAWALHPTVAIALWAALLGWYMRLAVRERLFAVGGVLGVCMGAMLPLAWLWSELGARSIVWAPVVWMLVLSLAQALSHAGESMVPPRASGSSRWTSMTQFFHQAPAFNLPRAAFMLVAGTLNEWWASWRLLPVAILRALWSFGYDRAGHQHLTALVRAAWDSGNPAIDFIGVGGACDGDYPVTAP